MLLVFVVTGIIAGIIIIAVVNIWPPARMFPWICLGMAALKRWFWRTHCKRHHR